MASKQIEGQLSFADFLGAPEPVKASEPVAVSDPDDALFEAEYERLMQLFDRVRTEEFAPMKYLIAIAGGVKTSLSEAITFREALSRYVSDSTADTIAGAFTDRLEQELYDIIGTMHDEIG